MYYSTKPESNLFSGDEDDPTWIRQELINNPEHYHQTIEQLYNQDQTLLTDRNKNMYIYPLGLSALKGEKGDDGEWEGMSESYLVRFLMRDHLYGEIMKFRPQMVMISYSGRIKIEDQHFVEMMQEIGKVGKVMLFNHLGSNDGNNQ